MRWGWWLGEVGRGSCFGVWVQVGVSQTMFQNRTERHRIEDMFCFLNI